MNIDRMHEHEIERWENEGGNCLQVSVDIDKPLVYQKRSRLLTNSATNGHRSLSNDRLDTGEADRSDSGSEWKQIRHDSKRRNENQQLKRHAYS